MKMRNISCLKDKVHGCILWCEELGCLENKANSVFLFTQSRDELCAKISLPLLLSLFPGNINIISILDQGKGTTSLKENISLSSPLRTQENFCGEWGKPGT